MNRSSTTSHGVLSRRAFLATTTALAVGKPFTAETLAAPGKDGPLKIGFLGMGHSHFTEKHRVLRASPDFQLVGLCEEDDQVRARGPQDARWLRRDQLFEEAEAIVVESAPEDHAAHGKAALLAGRHVHLEKPPADSLAGFQQLIDLARTRQRQLQVGYMWRYNPGVNAALDAARQGWLGDVFLVRATMNTFIEGARRPEWGRFRGGAMFEQGCHLMDIVVRLLGRPSKVVPFLKTSGRFEDQLADNTLAVLEYPRAWGLITSAPLQPNAGPQRFLEILGTQGTARVQPLEPPGLVIDLKSPGGPYRAGRQDIPLPAYERYVDEFRALAAAIRGVRPLPVDLDTEREIQEALLAACEML